MNWANSRNWENAINPDKVMNWANSRNWENAINPDKVMHWANAIRPYRCYFYGEFALFL